jgi:hypothetical protein
VGEPLDEAPVVRDEPVPGVVPLCGEEVIGDVVIARSLVGADFAGGFRATPHAVDDKTSHARPAINALGRVRKFNVVPLHSSRP